MRVATAFPRLKLGRTDSTFSTFSSGGVTPISLTTNGGLLYVLNAGGAGNIAGFEVKDGVATAISGSNQPLSNSSAGGAQIQFNAGGTVLVVTEKATNRIVTYQVDKAGVASAPTTTTSVGSTPFGFDIDRQNHVVVSEAPGSALRRINSERMAALGRSALRFRITGRGLLGCYLQGRSVCFHGQPRQQQCLKLQRGAGRQHLADRRQCGPDRDAAT